MCTPSTEQIDPRYYARNEVYMKTKMGIIFSAHLYLYCYVKCIITSFLDCILNCRYHSETLVASHDNCTIE